MITRHLRGPALCPGAEGAVEWLPDALIEIDAYGQIQRVGPAPEGCPHPVSHPGSVLMPGLVDTHVHFPQTRIIGSAAGPLLDWLDTVVFPEEARFSARDYAEAVAKQFCQSLIDQGTTCAAIYGSSHIEACDALFQALDVAQLKAIAGPALMDRGAPDDVLLDADRALAGLERLRQRWHGHEDRLWLSVVPRFALSCTPDLLQRAGRFARTHDLWVQTHLSENKAEIQATAEMFPEAPDYLGVYEAADLAHERALLAHCIWLDDHQWDRLAARGASVSHCPDSNFFLGSGCMHLRHALDRDISVGLGTDVGAGRSFSIRRVAASAYDASLMVSLPVSPERLIWLATAGGAEAIGLRDRVGRLASGYDADIIAVPLQARDVHRQRSQGEAALYEQEKQAILDALIFQHDAGPVTATYTRGARLR